MKKYGSWFLVRRTLKLFVYYYFIRFKHATVSYRGKKLDVEVADARDKMQLGLSFRKGIANSAGMLFIYPRLERHIVWMLNMKFSIDILWLDENGRIVYIVKKAIPMRSISDFAIYEPKPASKYVLEMPAGTADRLRMSVGDVLILSVTVA